MLMAGTEWLVDATGCRADALSDEGLLREVFRRIVAELNLRTVGEGVWHKFPDPGGVTGLLLLSESHLACHTYPEFGVATFNLYCCRARPEWDWRAHLAEMLGATSVAVRTVARPLVEASEETEAQRAQTEQSLSAETEESPLRASQLEETPEAELVSSSLSSVVAARGRARGDGR